MSHGSEDEIECSDGDNLNENEVYKNFSIQNHPTLNGKPKIFIFQCCWGDRLNEVIEYALENPIEVDVTSYKQVSTTNKHRMSVDKANMITVHATIAGYVAIQIESTCKGSSFIKTFVKVLREKRYEKKEFKQQLTVVKKRMGQAWYPYSDSPEENPYMVEQVSSSDENLTKKSPSLSKSMAKWQVSLVAICKYFAIQESDCHSACWYVVSSDHTNQKRVSLQFQVPCAGSYVKRSWKLTSINWNTSGRLSIYKETIGELSGICEELEKKMKSTRKVYHAGFFATARGLLLGASGIISIPLSTGISNFVAGAGAATTTPGMLTLGSSIVATYPNNSKQEKPVLTLLEVDRQLTA